METVAKEYGHEILRLPPTTVTRGGTHDIFGRGCATIKSLYRPFLEFLTKKLDPFRNFCA